MNPASRPKPLPQRPQRDEAYAYPPSPGRSGPRSTGSRPGTAPSPSPCAATISPLLSAHPVRPPVRPRTTGDPQETPHQQPARAAARRRCQPRRPRARREAVEPHGRGRLLVSELDPGSRISPLAYVELNNKTDAATGEHGTCSISSAAVRARRHCVRRSTRPARSSPCRLRRPRPTFRRTTQRRRRGACGGVAVPSAPPMPNPISVRLGLEFATHRFAGLAPHARVPVASMVAMAA